MAAEALLDEAGIVAAILAFRPDVDAIYLHGSMATGYARADSDVDVALLTRRKIGFEEGRVLANAVQHVARREGDIMDLACASPIAQFAVMNDGRLLHARDPAIVARFEMLALRRYWEARRLRSPFIADMLADLKAASA